MVEQNSNVNFFYAVNFVYMLLQPLVGAMIPAGWVDVRQIRLPGPERP